MQDPGKDSCGILTAFHICASYYSKKAPGNYTTEVGDLALI